MRRAALLVALAAFVVLGAAGALVAAGTGTTYRSTTVLAIDQPAVLSLASEPGPVLKLERLRGQYALLLTTRAVLDGVAQETGTTAGEVERALRADAPRNSLLLTVSAHTDDPAESRRIAAAAADELVDWTATTQRDRGVDDEDAVVLSVASPARDGASVSRGVRTVTTVGLLTGLVAAAAALVLANRFERAEP